LNNISVYYTNLYSDFSKDKFDEYYNELPDLLKIKIDRLIRYKSKLHSLIGLKLLSIALNDFNFTTEKLKEIKYLKDGKPYIPNTFYFNISHSEDIVICACYNGSIGIDIEKVKPRNIEKLKTFLNKKEYEILSKSAHQDKLFADIWTQKEAFSKTISKGMNLTFSDINIRNLMISYKNKNWYLYPVNIDNNYSSHICIADNNKNIDIKNITHII
jgi:4'-phosphopantetheinyl transferase